MFMSILVLAVSAALFFFYVQIVCEKALRREFSHPYFKQVLQSLQLEYPQLCKSAASDGRFNYSSTLLGLKCDFFTLKYLLRNSDPARRPLARSQKLLILYFQGLLMLLPLRHAFRMNEKKAVMKLSAILQFFANSLGETLSGGSYAEVQSSLQS